MKNYTVTPKQFRREKVNGSSFVLYVPPLPMPGGHVQYLVGMMLNVCSMPGGHVP
jgi:hypothetical protein